MIRLRMSKERRKQVFNLSDPDIQSEIANDIIVYHPEILEKILAQNNAIEMKKIGLKSTEEGSK